MRTLNEVEVRYPGLKEIKDQASIGFFDRLEQKKLLVILILLAVGFSARATGWRKPAWPGRSKQDTRIRSYRQATSRQTANTRC